MKVSLGFLGRSQSPSSSPSSKYPDVDAFERALSGAYSPRMSSATSTTQVPGRYPGDHQRSKSANEESKPRGIFKERRSSGGSPRRVTFDIPPGGAKDSVSYSQDGYHLFQSEEDDPFQLHLASSPDKGFGIARGNQSDLSRVSSSGVDGNPFKVPHQRINSSDKEWRESLDYKSTFKRNRPYPADQSRTNIPYPGSLDREGRRSRRASEAEIMPRTRREEEHIHKLVDSRLIVPDVQVTAPSGVGLRRHASSSKYETRVSRDRRDDHDYDYYRERSRERDYDEAEHRHRRERSHGRYDYDHDDHHRVSTGERRRSHSRVSSRSREPSPRPRAEERVEHVEVVDVIPASTRRRSLDRNDSDLDRELDHRIHMKKIELQQARAKELATYRKVTELRTKELLGPDGVVITERSLDAPRSAGAIDPRVAVINPHAPDAAFVYGSEPRSRESRRRSSSSHPRAPGLDDLRDIRHALPGHDERHGVERVRLGPTDEAALRPDSVRVGRGRARSHSSPRSPYLV